MLGPNLSFLREKLNVVSFLLFAYCCVRDCVLVRLICVSAFPTHFNVGFSPHLRDVLESL